MKVCRECNVEKHLSEFYKHDRMADGHLNKCKFCVKKIVHKHREKNIEQIRLYDKQRATLPHRVKSRSEYAKTENGKKSKQKAMKLYVERYPMKKAAHTLISNAVRDGRLKRQFECSVCKSTQKIEAHHDDYTKPFDVRWLCEKCHKNWHKTNTPIYS